MPKQHKHKDSKLIKYLLILICFTTFSVPSFGTDSLLGLPDPTIDTPDFVSVDELLYQPAAETPCATGAFANALAKTVDQVNESDDEITIQTWIYNTLGHPDVLQTVLNCPELANVADDEQIKFLPIEYTFPQGRHIVINYETQPKILKQRLALGQRANLPSNPSPRIGDPADPSIWTHTDPAWYGILVTEAGSLDEYVGPDKNNTISLKYISDNIDKLYPKGSCTDKSALADNWREVNRAGKRTVAQENDSNDYYVAGDANLQWITWAEVALDVALTVVTFGGGAVVLGAVKGTRAVRALNNLSKSLNTLRKTPQVRNYIKLSNKYKKASAELKNIDRAKDAAAYEKKAKEVSDLSKSIETAEKTEKEVQQFKETAETFAELNKYRNSLRGVRVAQRGNMVARGWRALKAANTGNKILRRGGRVARASMKSGKTRDLLFHSTLKNIGKVAKLQETSGIAYGVIEFIGGMYDYTETSTGDFTSGVEFSPLLLLSADDIPDQGNVVNHGMWLMWSGDSISPADDDAAYLQAMDFAEKFYQELTTLQEEQNTHECNVDIYVVRPVLRNPGENDAELYYLIMNDSPWSTKKDSAQ